VRCYIYTNFKLLYVGADVIRPIALHLPMDVAVRKTELEVDNDIEGN
jgi:hypothetical protein